MEEFIDQNKLTKFEVICLFLMATYKEKDLCELQKKDGFIGWGEIERYNRFGIDFTKLGWLQDVATNWCPERLSELMDKFANAGFELHQYLEIKPHIRYKNQSIIVLFILGIICS